MLQPSRVLPSNAPPLQEGSDGLQQASRVLQEHSGNRQQHHDFGTSAGWDQTKYLYEQQQYPANVLTGENAYPGQQIQHQQYQPHQYQQHQHQHHQHHLYHPQPQYQHAAWRYGYRGAHGQVDERKVQYNAERLYRRFRQSDHYVKYRARQAKDDKGHGDQKWPDHLEKAFFRALITYPPMGRRKQLHQDKQRGRNELIADCIEELTGEARTRKQVSSHIQVLKPFVEGDPDIMKWLSKDDMRAQGSHYHGHSYQTGRRMSTYHPATAASHGMRSAMPALPRTDAQGVQQLKQSPQAFEPADFQMFIQRKYKDVGKEEKIDRLHTYSQAVSHPHAEDHPMSDWHTLARDFPQLAEAYAQRPLDCTVVIAEASLAFPTDQMEKWKDREGASIELGIYFQCRSRMLPTPRPGMKSPVSLLNKFYDHGTEVQGFSETTEVYFHNVPDSASVETEIKFGSKFWAKTLGSVGNKMRNPLTLTQQQRDEIDEYIRSLNAVQEVYVATDRGRERIMIIHWNFRLSSGKCGRASWRRLVLPEHAGIYTAPQQQRKTERADSFYDYSGGLGDLTGTANQHQQIQQHPLPALQSPFEYDTGSSANSALSSATWPTTLNDTGVSQMGAAHIDSHSRDFNTAPDNAFDFNAGNININYDPALSFDTFDSSAFNFDDTGVDFAAGPALGDFSQESWYDSQFETSQQQSVTGLGVEGASFNTQPGLDTAGGSMYGATYGDGGAVQQYDSGVGQGYAVPSHDQQAFGGAVGPDMIKEDALAALADASDWARSLGTK